MMYAVLNNLNKPYYRRESFFNYYFALFLFLCFLVYFLQSLSTDYRISYPPSSGETQEEDLSRSFSHKNTIHGPNPVFHELDDTDVGGIVNGDNGGEKGLPFKTASVQRIQELAGWSQLLRKRTVTDIKILNLIVRHNFCLKVNCLIILFL